MHDYAEINGARLYYEYAGSGEPLLLIHTGNGSTDLWAGQFEALAETYRVIRFDLRGFGRSGYPPGPFLWPADARDLLRYLGVERAHVVGASLGGRIGLELALIAPGLVASLVLAAPVLREQAWSAEVVALRAREDEHFLAGDFAGAATAMMQSWVAGPHRTLDQVDPAVVEAVRRTQLVSYRTRYPAETGPDPAGPEESLDPPASDRLAEVTVPTLVMVGDLDQPDCQRVAHQLAGQLPDAQLAIVEGAAHMLTLERPREFLELTRDFLAARSRIGTGRR